MAKGQKTMNGSAPKAKYIDTIDMDDPEFQRQLRRPAEVKQDVQQMEQQKRVNMILKSQTFKKELENIVVEQLKSGQTEAQQAVAADQALQQLQQMFPGQAPKRRGASTGVIPVADFTGSDLSAYGAGEKLLRCKLASFYRLVDVFGWNQDEIFLTACDENRCVFVAPSRLPYGSVTAGSLVKVTPDGQLVGHGDMNREVLALNHAAHASGKRCVVLLKTPAAIHISMEYGKDEDNAALLPLSLDAMSLGSEAPVVKADDTESIQASFSSDNRVSVVFVEGRGLLLGGDSVEEAFHLTRSAINTTELQMRVSKLDLYKPSADTQRAVFNRINEPIRDEGMRLWRRGELEFEALMRKLELSGCRTGYSFRAPLNRQAERADRVNSEVEVPPSSTSFAQGDMTDASMLSKKESMRAEWLNSPHNYKKEEIEEKGAPVAKKITKWVPSEGPGSLIKIDNANQFVPVGTNLKEVKEKFREIRRDHFDENITCGPQSKILEGVTWEEAQKIKEGNVQSDTVIVVGAASRAVIQRGHQQSANMYTTYYPPNPFENMTEEDIEDYRAEINRRTGGGGGDSRGVTSDEEVIVPGPDGRLISTEERIQQVKQAQAEGRKTPEVDKEVTEEIKRTSKYIEEQAAKQIEATAPNPKVAEPAKPTTTKAPAVHSPAKSTSSGEGTHGDMSGTDAGTSTSTPAGGEKKKKKRGFRMPSFSSKKKDKQ